MVRELTVIQREVVRAALASSLLSGLCSFASAGLLTQVSTVAQDAAPSSLRSMSVSNSGNVNFLAASALGGKSAANNKVQAFSVRKGEKARLQEPVMAVAMSVPAGRTAEGYDAVSARYARGSNSELPSLLFHTRGGVLYMQRGGNPPVELSGDFSRFEIGSFAVSKSGAYYFGGSQGTRAAVYQLDEFGKIKRSYLEDAHVGSVVGVLERSDGGMDLLIESLTGDVSVSKIVRISSEWKVEAELNLDGKPLDFAGSLDGAKAVLLAKEGAEGVKVIEAVGLTTRLSVSWRTALASGFDVAPKYRIFADGDGYLAFGRKDRSLMMLKIGSAGDVLARSWFDPRNDPELEVVVDFEVDRNSEKYAVVYDALIVKNRVQSKVTRLGWFSPG